MTMMRKKRKAVRAGNKEGDEPKPPQELSKRQELNNHIVCMRNTVAQVRVQIINRLIHQVKKYKGRKGEEKDQEKAKRKAERLLEEIQALKKLKKDRASLYALQDTTDLESALADPTTSPEDKVLARVSHHNLIKLKVNKYREANPNWAKQIPVLLAMTREKRKPKKDIDNAINAVTQPMIVLKKANSSDDDDVGEPSQKVAKRKTPFADPDESDGSSEDEKKTVKAKGKLERKPTKPPATETTSDSEEEEESSSKPVKESVIKAPKVLRLDKVEGTVKVKLLTDLNDLELDNSKAEETHREKTFVNITQAPSVRRPKSGFFVGGVDEPEEDRAPPARNQDRYSDKQTFNSNRGDNSQPIYRKGKLITKAPFRPNKPDFQQKRGPPQFNDRRPHNNQFTGNSEPLNPRTARPSGFNNSESQFNPRNSSQIRPTPEPSHNQPASEKLHPSWEAKKKQQQITAFAGKRVVFDDDD